jgi:hypothetical protein
MPSSLSPVGGWSTLVGWYEVSAFVTRPTLQIPTFDLKAWLALYTSVLWYSEYYPLKTLPKFYGMMLISKTKVVLKRLQRVLGKIDS